MDQITTIGIDLAKNVFQVHAVDASEKLVFSRAVKRAAFLPMLVKMPPCLIGMEACSGAHHWARQLLKNCGNCGDVIPIALFLRGTCVGEGWIKE